MKCVPYVDAVCSNFNRNNSVNVIIFMYAYYAYNIAKE